MSTSISKNFYDISIIPKNWTEKRLKNILSISENKSSNFNNEKILSLTKKGIVINDISSNKGQIAESYEKYIKVKKGQICMNPMDLLSGWVDISNFEGLISPAYYTFELNEEVDNKFINYFLQSNYLRKTFFKLGKGVASHDNFGRWVLTPDELKNICLFIPNIEEQKLISHYLDKKTENINKLIDKIHKKIELLNQKRSSLINQFVLKGNDPNAEMKNSGVKWIGDIPNHWKLGRFKYYISVLTDYTANGSFKSLADNIEYLSEGYSRLIRLTDLRRNLQNNGIYVSFESHNFLKKSELFGNEILIANVGAYTGLALKMKSKQGVCTLGPNMFLVRNNYEMSNVDYVIYLINSYSIKTAFDLVISSTAQPKINKDNLKSLVVPIPPKKEQEEIAIALNKTLKTIDNVIDEENKRVFLLNEYRRSLISSVIMGKLRITKDMI